MAILPSKARPTWAGVLVSESGGERLVPWIDALDRSAVVLDGRQRRIEYRRFRDNSIAAAHQRRAVARKLRARQTVVWKSAYVNPVLDRAALIAVGVLMGSLGVLAVVTGLSEGMFRKSPDEPVFTMLRWTFDAFITFGPLTACIAVIWLLLHDHRTRLISVEADRDHLKLMRGDRTIAVAISDVRSLAESFGGKCLVTALGERVSLRHVPTPLVAAWLSRRLPAVIERHEAAESRAIRRGAVVMFFGLAACVLLAWVLDRFYGLLDSSKRPDLLQALLVVPIMPALMWWMSKHGRSVKPRAALADGSR